MGLTLLNLEEARRAARERVAAEAAEKLALAKEGFAPLLSGLSTGDPEDPKFMRITSPSTRRDLNPLMHERMQAVCYYLRVTTPFGRRIIQVIVDYVVGEGFKATAQDPQVQAVLDRFWSDHVNNLDENIPAYTDELLTLGELCIPVAVNPVDGFVRLGYVDPMQIEAVEYGMMQTGTNEELSVPVAVRLRRSVGESEGRRLTLIRLDEDINSPTFGQLTGDAFYFAINRAKGATRGISELFALADWVDVFDQMVFDFADKIRFLNQYVWEYTVSGADQKIIDKFREDLKKFPPRQGGYQVHNDQVKIAPVTPDLKGGDMSEAARVVKLYGMGGAGLPAWFFADPVDANRSTAQEMQGPTGKMLTNRQNVIRRLIFALGTFAIDQAVAHGVLPLEVKRGWQVQTPDLSVKDMEKVSNMLQAVTNSVGIAEDRGWVRAETAALAVHTILGQIGVEVSDFEFEQAQLEKQNRDAQNVNQLAPQQGLADALAAAKGQKQLPTGDKGMIQ